MTQPNDSPSLRYVGLTMREAERIRFRADSRWTHERAGASGRNLHSDCTKRRRSDGPKHIWLELTDDDNGVKENVATFTFEKNGAAATINDAAAGFDNVIIEYDGRPTAHCGDGVINGTDQCDGSALGGNDCTTLGFSSGTLGCTGDCEWDTSGCTDPPTQTCNNGKREGTEECDGSDLDGAVCPSNSSGTPSCTTDCVLDTSSCVDDSDDAPSPEDATAEVRRAPEELSGAPSCHAAPPPVVLVLSMVLATLLRRRR